MQEPSDARTEWTDHGWHQSDRSRPRTTASANWPNDSSTAIAGANIPRSRTTRRLPRAGRRDPPTLPGPVADGRAQARPGRRRRLRAGCPGASGWATSGSSARSAAAAWASSTRPSRSRSAGASPSRSCRARRCATPSSSLRFQREARAAARLHHTNIVPVFGVGEHEGIHYLRHAVHPGPGPRRGAARSSGGSASRLRSRSRDRLRDPSRPERRAADVAESLLTGRFAARAAVPETELGADTADRPARPDSVPRATPRLPSSCPASPSHRSPARLRPPRTARSVARIGLQVAEALEYAHRQGIAPPRHQAVEPAARRPGNVWVADFGLAKVGRQRRPDAHRRHRRHGPLHGPRAVRGQVRRRARDVYALGLTLYELLALRPGVRRRRTAAALIRQVTTRSRRGCGGWTRRSRATWRRSSHKAIEREPARRYADAVALADDLRRFLDDRPIQARRIGRRSRPGGGVGGTRRRPRWWRRPSPWSRWPPRGGRNPRTARAGRDSRSNRRWSRSRHGGRRAAGPRRRPCSSRPTAGSTTPACSGCEPSSSTRSTTWIWRPGWRTSGSGERDCSKTRPTTDPRPGNMPRCSMRPDRNSRTIKPSRIASGCRRSGRRSSRAWTTGPWSRKTRIMRSRLLQIARWADPDPSWRDRVRDPAVRHDRKVLEQLAAECARGGRAAAVVDDTGRLAQAGRRRRRAAAPRQRRRPTDFWLNYELGRMLTEVKPWDAIGFYRAALALRPETSSIYYNLGLAQVCAAIGRRHGNPIGEPSRSTPTWPRSGPASAISSPQGGQEPSQGPSRPAEWRIAPGAGWATASEGTKPEFAGLHQNTRPGVCPGTRGVLPSMFVRLRSVRRSREPEGPAPRGSSISAPEAK